MTDAPTPLNSRTAAAVADLLGKERLMTVAVNGTDGWPHATTVGYYNEGLDLYFVVARSSRKFRNLQSDTRASVVIRAPSGGGSVGLSMAGHVVEVTDSAAVESLDQRLVERYPDVHVYCPSGDAVAMLRFRPVIITAVGVVEGRSHPETFVVEEGGPRSGSPADVSRLF